MNYRILRVSWCRFPSVMPSSLSSRECDGAGLSYEQRLTRFLDYRVLYFNGFAREMRALGNEAHEVISDCRHLQKQWAIEQGSAFLDMGHSWQTDILLSQIAAIRPEVLLLQMGPFALPFAVRRRLKDLFPFIKRIVVSQAILGFCGTYADIDLLLAGSPLLVEEAVRAGVPVRLVYHGFDETILPALNEQAGTIDQQLDLTFSGVSGWGEGCNHPSRYWHLVQLVQALHLHAWVMEGYEDPIPPGVLLRLGGGAVSSLLAYGIVRPVGLALRPFQTALKKELWDTRLALRERLRLRGKRKALPGDMPKARLCHVFPRNCQGPLFGLDMYRMMNRSKVSFNMHDEAKRGSVDNIRMFDTTGVGSCLLTDGGSNLVDLFEADREVVTYGSLDECVEKARYLLDHDSERETIADRGKRRTLRDHTVRQRVQQMDAAIRAIL